MTIDHTNQPTGRKPLRVVPGVIIVALVWVCWIVVPAAVPDWSVYAIFGMVAGIAATLVWWLFFSRAPWPERLAALAVMAAGVYVTSFFVDRSISNGMMGFMLYIYSVPLLALGLVAGVVIGRNRSPGLRRAAIAVAIAIACAGMTLVRTGGMSGQGDGDIHWRWTPTPEERLLAEARDVPPPPPARPVTAPPEPAPAPPAAAEIAPSAPPAAAAKTPEKADEGAPSVAAAPTVAKRPAEWPGFRGPARDSVIHGVQIETNWTQSPPQEMWRRAVGPGWSSFAVDGDRIFTQEQRGNEEVVAAYSLKTGEPVWMHRDPIRFWESNGGAGPRGTPTIANGRIYTMGATGLLNALDERDGALIWSINTATDTKREIPDWGIASSPLVIDDLVIVAVAGQLAAYDVRDGHRRWLGPGGGGGYSSPHLMTIDGVPQVVLLRGARSTSHAIKDGTKLWEHMAEPSVAIVQPGLTENGDVLIGAGDSMGGLGLRRVTVKQGPSGWTLEERWHSRGLRPYFNDFVVHNGHAFGFDGSILACIDLATGERKWKGGRYGMGQMMLLAEQSLLFIVSEEGDLVLVSATPDKYTEIAKVKAIEGKTWNHPVLVGDVVLVRNGEEMAAFRLARAETTR